MTNRSLHVQKMTAYDSQRLFDVKCRNNPQEHVLFKICRLQFHIFTRHSSLQRDFIGFLKSQRDSVMDTRCSLLHLKSESCSHGQEIQRQVFQSSSVKLGNRPSQLTELFGILLLIEVVQKLLIQNLFSVGKFAQTASCELFNFLPS